MSILCVTSYVDGNGNTDLSSGDLADAQAYERRSPVVGGGDAAAIDGGASLENASSFEGWRDGGSRDDPQVNREASESSKSEHIGRGGTRSTAGESRTRDCAFIQNRQRLVCPEGRPKWSELGVDASPRCGGTYGKIAHVPSNGSFII